MVFTAKGNKQYHIEKIAEQPPERNRQAENDSPRALGNGVAVYGFRYRAKTGISHIGVIAVVRLEQIAGHQNTGETNKKARYEVISVRQPFGFIDHGSDTLAMVDILDFLYAL